MDRIAMLSEILTANPEDSFARYGLAMEYSKAGQIEQAVHEFKTLIEKNPDYTPAYFMAAQTLAAASRVDEAKRMAGGRHRRARAAPATARAVGDDGHAGRTGRIICPRRGGCIRPPQRSKAPQRLDEAQFRLDLSS